MPLFRRPELHAALGRSAAWRAGLLAGMHGLLLATAAAQGTTDGAIHGVVEDATGRPVAGAQVMLRSRETGEVRLLRGRWDGTFLAPRLVPGSYSVSITAPGFGVVRFGPVVVALGQTLELLPRLEMAAVRVSTEVVAQGEETTAGIEASIGPEQMQLLPANGRRWQDFALTAPGVAPDENADGLLSVHGLAATQNSVVVDGAPVDQSFGSVPAGTGSDPAPDPEGDADAAERTTGPANGLARGRHAGVAYVFAQGAVREFRVSTQSYSVQTGRAGGGVMTTISRQGTGALHGSGSLVVRSSAFAASNPLAIATSYLDGVITSGVVKPHDLRESFAGSVGGPVPGAHGLFFFYAFDGQRRGFPAISSPANPDFYELSATQAALLGTRGVSAKARNAALNYVSSLTGSTPRRADQTIQFGRLDWKPGRWLGVGAEYNRVRWESPAGLIDAPVVARGRASLGNATGSLDAVQGRVTLIFSARTVNELRGSYLRDLQFETPQPSLAQEPGIGPGGQAPEVNIGPNGLLFGTPASLSHSAYPDESRIGVADLVTLVRGHHLIEIGGDLSLVEDRVATLGNAAGTFLYDSGATSGRAGGLVDFITDYTFNVNTLPNGGCPSIASATHLFCFQSFSQSFGEQETSFRTAEWAGFAEDTWRPWRRLTLHAGVRYEYTFLPLPARPNAALDAVFGVQGSTGVFPEDRNNFGPRASLAYAPFGAGRGSIRVGYGVFYGRLPGATISSALANTGLPGSTVKVRITPSAVTACPQVAMQGFGYPCAFTTQPPGVVAATGSAMVFDRRFRLPMVQQGSFSLERGVGRRVQATLGYVFNLDRQLPGSTDLNVAASTGNGIFQLQGGTGKPGVRDGEVFAVPVYTARVDPAFGPVTDVVSHTNATYHSLVAAVDSGAWAGVRMRANYTWSKAIDLGQTTSALPRTNGQFDPFSNGYDKGLSQLNYPWALHGTAVWQPRLEGRARWLRTVGNGWEAAPIVSARSGRPYSFYLSGGTSLAGGHQSLNGSGGALYLPTVGRDTLRLPAVATVDLRVARGFGIGAHVKVRLSAEAFNLFNHRNVSSVSQRAYLVGTKVAGVTPLVFQDAAAIAAEGLTSEPFGTPNASGSSLSRERQMQLGLKLDF